MKLIDILNLIAKGELEEGTKIKMVDGGEEFAYSKSPIDAENHNLYNEEGENLFDNYYLDIISDEVEIISKDTNAATKIEELTLEKSDLACQGIHAGDLFRNIESKLNEVIRELNRRSE